MWHESTTKVVFVIMHFLDAHTLKKNLKTQFSYGMEIQLSCLNKNNSFFIENIFLTNSETFELSEQIKKFSSESQESFQVFI